MLSLSTKSNELALENENQVLTARLLQSEEWVRRALDDNHTKQNLIAELEQEMQTLKLGQQKQALDWLAKKLALNKQLKEAQQQLAMKAHENKALRGFIFRQVQATISILGRPVTNEKLDYLREATVDPVVLSNPRWNWVSRDTIFIWGGDGIEQDRVGQVPFAVFHQPHELMEHQIVFLSLFDHLREFRYPLRRHTIQEGGICYGISWRGGYILGISYAEYLCPSQAGQTGAECALHPENIRIQEIAVKYAQIMEEVLQRRLSKEYEEKVDVVEKEGLPTLSSAESDSETTGVLPTEDYECHMHKDRGDEGVAHGVWLEQHDPDCARYAKGKSCLKHWAFLFPEHNVVVPIQHGTFIVWQGAQVYHGTVLQKHKNACKGHKALSVVTQIKRALIQRVRASKRKQEMSF